MTVDDKPANDPIRRSQELMRAELPKRFYKEVTIGERDGAFAILVDGRAVKTPGKQMLALPTRDAAELVRAEWQAQETFINPAKMPVTRLSNTIIDGVSLNGDAVFAEIVSYAGNDMLFYRAESPEELVARQAERWNPVLDWMAEHFGARFVLVEGVMFAEQPEESVAAFSGALEQHRNAFALGAMHSMTTLTGSALLSLAMIRGRLTLEDGWSLSNLEEDWTIEHWGQDAEAEARRARRFEDMKAAYRLFTSLG